MQEGIIGFYVLECMCVGQHQIELSCETETNIFNCIKLNTNLTVLDLSTNPMDVGKPLAIWGDNLRQILDSPKG